MHVAPAGFRVVRRDGVTLRFAQLGPIVYVVAEFPASGSRGTFAEEWCERPHWAMTVAGDVELDLDGTQHEVPSGTAFYIPPDIRHRLIVSPRARIAGFDRLPDEAPVGDEALRAAGFEVIRPDADSARRPAAIVQPGPERPPDQGSLVAASRRMGDLLYTRTRLGPRAGYTSAPCDLQHWGIVLAGSVAMEWEDSVEVLGAGDAFYCPPGPPGHRLLAADPAIVADFTPVAALSETGRVSSWRVAAVEAALADASPGTGLEVAALA